MSTESAFPTVDYRPHTPTPGCYVLTFVHPEVICHRRTGRFAVALETVTDDGDPRWVQLSMSAADLQCFSRFQRAVMRQAGFVFRHASEGAKYPHDVWLRAIDFAMREGKKGAGFLDLQGSFRFCSAMFHGNIRVEGPGEEVAEYLDNWD